MGDLTKFIKELSGKFLGYIHRICLDQSKNYNEQMKTATSFF